MQGLRVCLVLALNAALLPGCTPRQPIRIMSFNIRYGTAQDGENRWENRRELLFQTIRDLDPDILGLQEVLAFQTEELRAALPMLGFVGVGRDDGREGGEFTPIMYRRQTFDLQRSGHVWLSPTPDLPGSKGWDAALPRMATWVVLRTRAAPHVELFVLNTHLDHQGEQARLEAARILRGMIAARGAHPTILTGDFNCGPGSPPYEVLTTDAGIEGLRDPWVALSSERVNTGTYHAFSGVAEGPRIDFVLCNGHCEPLAVEIDRRSAGSAYPSDHYPVLATLRLRRVH